jgi:hypothetical protein
MEAFPAIDMEQFEYIKKVIDECDYYLLIVGARYGSTDEEGVSFTEREFDLCALRWKDGNRTSAQRYRKSSDEEFWTQTHPSRSSWIHSATK